MDGSLDRGWPLGAAAADYVLGHVRAVLPDRVVDDARVVVRDGRVVEVGPHPPGTRADLDGRGLACLPGLVDVHCDVLSRDDRPRPGVQMPPGFTVASARTRLAAVGITTAFHGIAFQVRSAVGLSIDSPGSPELYDALVDAGQPVLHRVDVRCPDGIELFGDRLRRSGDRRPLLVSHEDHTPGQGQYADPATMVDWLVRGEGMSPDQASRHVADLRDDRAGRGDLADQTLCWLGDLAADGDIVLLGHDPRTPQDVAGVVGRHARAAEFPTTVSAAQEARRHGLLVVAGAPNVVRGRSHSGNVSATELVDLGLVDALTSDYLPASMLASVAVLVGSGRLDLPRAVALVTGGPARVAGLADRGALAPGRRADLVLTDLAPVWPVAVACLTAS